MESIYCDSCQKDQDVVKRENDENTETICLACGHKKISTVLTETIHLSEFISAKHRNSSRKLLNRMKTKISKGTKLPATDDLTFDRDRGKKFHKVWEENSDGTRILVHDEEVPLEEKEKK
ncbi:MAG: hypothetical protein MUQ00_10165 [Candidatus Aminicenantes bacterium]|nr:hypothetical protein [Candidatus Aminicenantes bacterium]